MKLSMVKNHDKERVEMVEDCTINKIVNEKRKCNIAIIKLTFSGKILA